MGGIEGGFVSVWRKMHEWEWFDDDTVFKIFIGLLWLANYKEQQWKGITIKRGSFVTSIGSLCSYFGKSKTPVVRTLKLLESTGEIIDDVMPNKYRIITVENYDKYQLVQDVGLSEGNSDGNSNTNSKTKRNNKKAANKSTNKNANRNTNKSANSSTDSSTTTNKEISGGVCPTDTHTPPKEGENAASPSVPHECGTNEPQEKKHLRSREESLEPV